MSYSICESFNTTNEKWHIISSARLRTPAHRTLIQSSHRQGQRQGSALTTELPQSLTRTRLGTATGSSSHSTAPSASDSSVSVGTTSFALAASPSGARHRAPTDRAAARPRPSAFCFATAPCCYQLSRRALRTLCPCGSIDAGRPRHARYRGHGPRRGWCTWCACRPWSN